MCICTSEVPRSRLFNCVTVLLVTVWVVMVSVVAHTVEVEPVGSDQMLDVFISSLIN